MNNASLLFRVANGVMLSLFVIAIAVQYNDPDSVKWALIYLPPLFITSIAFRKIILPLTVAGAVIYATAAYMWWPFESDVPLLDSEQKREAGGLIFSAFWLSILTIIWYARSRPGTTPKDSTPEYKA